MPMRSKLQTITENNVGRRLPKKRPPTHPGEMLLEEFVKPLEITQTALAQSLGVSYPRLNEIILIVSDLGEHDDTITKYRR